MKHLPLLALIVGLTCVQLPAQATAKSPLSGRWDLTIKTPKDMYPSWMEFIEKDGGTEVRIVGRVSSVHPATLIKVEGSKLSFTTSEWFQKPISVTWELEAKRGMLVGLQKRSDGVSGNITGVRAPALMRKAPAKWSEPEPLFNGKDLSGWEADEPDKNHYKAIGGELINESPGANIRTKRKFQDFKLHIEYNCPEGGNSGVYLRGRYEIQVAYEPSGTNDEFHDMGSIYGFLAPSERISPRPGNWESFDVTFIGRKVTLVRNGKTIIDNKEVPGITGGALDSNESQPGPLQIQGDHTGGMKYRNITISVPKG